MSLISLAALCVIAALVIMVNAKFDNTHAMCIRIVAACIIFGIIIPQIKPLFKVVNLLAGKIKLHEKFLAILFKIIGIAYTAEFSSQLLEDCGEGGMAKKIQLYGMILILAEAIPVLIALVELIATLL